MQCPILDCPITAITNGLPVDNEIDKWAEEIGGDEPPDPQKGYPVVSATLGYGGSGETIQFRPVFTVRPPNKVARTGLTKRPADPGPRYGADFEQDALPFCKSTFGVGNATEKAGGGRSKWPLLRMLAKQVPREGLHLLSTFLMIHYV
jgi:hypothetical protein